jgi:hypothetical protein
MAGGSMTKLRSFVLWVLGLASFVGLVVTLSLWVRTYFVNSGTADAVTGSWMTPAEVRPFVTKNISVESSAGGVTPRMSPNRDVDWKYTGTTNETAYRATLGV